jgi:hypothetical protein
MTKQNNEVVSLIDAAIFKLDEAIEACTGDDEDLINKLFFHRDELHLINQDLSKHYGNTI